MQGRPLSPAEGWGSSRQNDSCEPSSGASSTFTILAHFRHNLGAVFRRGACHRDARLTGAKAATCHPDASEASVGSLSRQGVLSSENCNSPGWRPNLQSKKSKQKSKEKSLKQRTQ